MKNARVVEILRDLIRFDTTNPPGNERRCVEFIAAILRDVGMETKIMAKDASRPNLVARVAGRRSAPALMLLGHVDVVTTEHQRWSVPPFEGRIERGCVWGRGALDMKAGVAMMIDALLDLVESGAQPAVDVLLTIVSDEEAGGRYGAQFLVEESPELFAGVRYALGEFGGFPIYMDGAPVYLVQVAEKQPCWMQVTFRGPAGHGALRLQDGAMAELGRVLVRLNQRRLPVHVTSATRQMIRRMAEVLPSAKRWLFLRLLNPQWTDLILRLLGETGHQLDPLLRNTVNATVVRGGDKPNVIPAEVSLGLDGRILPGFRSQDLLRELEKVVGCVLEAQIVSHDPGPDTVDLSLMPFLEGVLRRAHPGCHVAPYLLPGSSDARFFGRLGIQSYGFLPMNLPRGFDFFRTIHAADERIPVECVEFGARAMADALRRFDEGAAAGSPTAQRSVSAAERLRH
jgi:acetylornithine deacetylase/succinyl-diaminopimelate desuccinylase-like protein